MLGMQTLLVSGGYSLHEARPAKGTINLKFLITYTVMILDVGTSSVKFGVVDEGNGVDYNQQLSCQEYLIKNDKSECYYSKALLSAIRVDDIPETFKATLRRMGATFMNVDDRIVVCLNGKNYEPMERLGVLLVRFFSRISCAVSLPSMNLGIW